MALYLEILDGELKGTRTPISDGLVIGRKEGSLTIRDSKLSGKHARIERRSDNSFWMHDLGSSNAIKVQEERVRELKLEPGVSFTLGRTRFLVISSGEPVVTTPEPPPATLAVTVTRTFWDVLRDLLERASREARYEKIELLPFQPVLRLCFTRGLQAGTEWTLGYGPRSVGSASLDLQLEDLSLPGACFRLEPLGRGVLFKNLAEPVRLNGKEITASLLKHGDIIDISTTQLQVFFDER